MKNIDTIKNMSCDELAEWLLKVSQCCYGMICNGENCDDKPCKLNIKHWLNKETE